MKKIIGLVALLLMTVSGVKAQTKRELKAIAKQKELVGLSTNEDGSRFFYTKTGDIKFEIRNCTKKDSEVIISILVRNNSDTDCNLTIYGDDGGEYHDFPEVTDNLGNGAYYQNRSINHFADASMGKLEYKDKLEKLFVPAYGALKISFFIGTVYPEATSFSNLEFTFKCESANQDYQTTAKVYDLTFE